MPAVTQILGKKKRKMHGGSEICRWICSRLGGKIHVALASHVRKSWAKKNACWGGGNQLGNIRKKGGVVRSSKQAPMSIRFVRRQEKGEAAEKFQGRKHKESR